MADNHDPTGRPRDPDRKWFTERLERTDYGSEKAIGAALGMSANVMPRVMRGMREATIGEAIKLAELLKVPFPEVVRRLGFDLPPLTVPIIGHVRGDGRISILPPAQQTRISAPTDSDGDTVALEVRAAQTALGIFDGAVLYYEPGSTVKADAFGRLSVIEAGDQPAPLLGVLDRATIGRVKITLYGGQDVIETAQCVSASPVRWTRAG